jgi:Neutral/alkaline non-lysosomal ceramidase, N-terminal
MPGYIARKNVALGQADPLYVRALVLQKGKVRAAILVADVLLISNRWASRLRARLGKILDVPSDNVIVAATHTHSGPMIDTAPFDLLQSEIPGGPSPSTAMRRVDACMEQALSAAARSMHRVKAEVARVFVSKVATDRNDPARVTRQPLYLLRFTARNRQTILGVYGCHSTLLGPDNTLLSGDLLGEISRRLEQDADVALVGAGAAANISTRFTRRGQTFEEVRRMASLVHKQISQARFHPLPATNVSVRSLKLRLPVRDLHQRQRATGEKTGRLAEVEKEGRKVLTHLRNSPEFTGGSVNVPFTQVTLGDVSLVALPFEMFSDTGDFFWESAQAVLLGYANGYWGYLPSPAASTCSYETLSSPYDQRADAILRNAVSPARVDQRPPSR